MDLSKSPIDAWLLNISHSPAGDWVVGVFESCVVGVFESGVVVVGFDGASEVGFDGVSDVGFDGSSEVGFDGWSEVGFDGGLDDGVGFVGGSDVGSDGGLEVVDELSACRFRSSSFCNASSTTFAANSGSASLMISMALE